MYIEIFFLGEQACVFMAQGKAGAINNSPASTMDVLSGNQDLRPQWVPQVLERATQLAVNNAAAHRFVVSAQDNLVQLLPAQADAIKAAAAR